MADEAKTAAGEGGAEASGSSSIAEAYARLVVNAGARSLARQPSENSIRTLHDLISRRRRSVQESTGSTRHAEKRLAAVHKKHAFWETQPVVQFNEQVEEVRSKYIKQIVSLLALKMAVAQCANDLI